MSAYKIDAAALLALGMSRQQIETLRYILSQAQNVIEISVAGNGLSYAGGVITSNATAANTTSTIVYRDGSGNFAAGTITAALSGNATSATSATTAARWTTSRNLVLNGDGSATLAVDGSGNVTAAFTLATVTAAKGGTGQTSYAVGDILYASTTTALSKLAGVATGNALISGGANAAPAWGKIGLTTHVSGTLAEGNGGTGLTSLALVWTAPTLLNSWVNFGGSYQVAGYTKDIFGTVHLRGLLKSGTIGGGNAMFTLPVGYRPSKDEPFVANSADAGVGLYVRTNGNVEPINGSNTYFSLTGLSFSTS